MPRNRQNHFTPHGSREHARLIPAGNAPAGYRAAHVLLSHGRASPVRQSVAPRTDGKTASTAPPPGEPWRWAGCKPRRPRTSPPASLAGGTIVGASSGAESSSRLASRSFLYLSRSVGFTTGFLFGMLATLFRRCYQGTRWTSNERRSPLVGHT